MKSQSNLIERPTQITNNITKVALFAGFAPGGAVLATVVTIAAWNALIEPRAFQCIDTLWPFNDYWVSMNTHALSNDTLSPGWTWEKLEFVRILFIAVFFLLWIASTIVLIKKFLPGFRGLGTASEKRMR